VPLQIPSQPDLEPQIAMDSVDINSDAMSADEGHKEHRHKVTKSDNHQDYGIAGVLIHIAGDAFNNIGVIIAGLVIWKSTSPNRYYADPTVSMAIALMILLSAVPLGKLFTLITNLLTTSSQANGSHSAAEPADEHRCRRHQARSRKGRSSLHAASLNSRHQVPGVVSIHELHVWRLNQQKSLATTHIVVDNDSLTRFQTQAKTILECLHAYGVHSVTIQPELSALAKTKTGEASPEASCLMNCGTVCEDMTCCG
jgi:zinc transporter 1